MFCPDCGTWNRADAAACSRCGVELPDVRVSRDLRLDEELLTLRRATGLRYRIVRRIGSGGMADVYLGEQSALARPVVIKVLHPHLARDPEVAERFRREAEAAAQLLHPHVCAIFDVGVLDGMVYMVLPYLPGGSLSERIAREKTLDPPLVAAVAVQVACALDYAHRAGVIHRDVKPDNVLFDDDDNAVLTDFGIATARFHGRLTASGRAMGTPHYMSPEQAMGKLVDGRSDLYALGVVMYEALAGFTPFDGADAFSVSYKQVHEMPVPLSQVSTRAPEVLASIVMRCLAKSPADRYARGLDLADALIGFLAAVPGGAVAKEQRAAFVARHGGRGMVTPTAPSPS